MNHRYVWDYDVRALKPPFFVIVFMLWNALNFFAWHDHNWILAVGLWCVAVVGLLQFFKRVQQDYNHLNHRVQRLEQQLDARQIDSQSLENSQTLTPHLNQGDIEQVIVSTKNNERFEVGYAPSLSTTNAGQITDQERKDQIDPSLTTSQTTRVSSVPAWLQTSISWAIHGNPILRLAIVILLIGVVLLLRFASEYWQLSLGLKLSMIALGGAVISTLSYLFRHKNFNFSIVLQGFGLAVIFLTLGFAHHFHVIASLTLASFCLAILLLTTIILSLKQNTIYLAVFALGMAYIAPFVIPQYQPEPVLLWGYYSAVNVAVLIINYLKPWKLLNHLAFFSTLTLGGQALFTQDINGHMRLLDGLLWLNLLLFIWLSVRYSQLKVKDHLDPSRSSELLDVSLIFSVPVLGFSLHAALRYGETWPLTNGAILLALIYAVLTWWIHRKQQALSLLAKSFFILAMAFVALIFPLSQGAHWTSLGWVIQGTALVVWGVTERYRFSLLVGQILLALSSFALFYQIASDDIFPLLGGAVYGLAQLIAVFYMLHYVQDKQIEHPRTSALITIFLGIAIYALALVGVNLLHWQALGGIATNVIATIIYVCFVGYLSWRSQLHWSLQQMFISMGLMLGLMIAMCNLSGNINMHQPLIRSLGFISAILQLMILYFSSFKTSSWHFMQHVHAIVLWCLAAMMGAFIFTSHDVLAYGIFPAIFGIVLLLKRDKTLLANVAIFILNFIWLLVINALYDNDQYYWLAILNPADLSSLCLLTVTIYTVFKLWESEYPLKMLTKIATLFLTLWVLSSVLVRVLHYLFATPLWSFSIWYNGVVQLSLTLLWVILASVLMIYASRKIVRGIWLIGAGLLIVVVFKLVLLDLSQSSTLLRVLSFIGAGIVMLVIAYLAPLPPMKDKSSENVDD
ncbi:MAG: DUF2339 domain-containing protein [Acinetobacter sp.]